MKIEIVKRPRQFPVEISLTIETDDEFRALEKLSKANVRIPNLLYSPVIEHDEDVQNKLLKDQLSMPEAKSLTTFLHELFHTLKSL